MAYDGRREEPPYPGADDDLRIALAAAEEQLSAAERELETLREVRKKLDEATSALADLACWREHCREYDLDMGYKPREFFDEEDWGLMESAAQRALDAARKGE